MTINYDQLRLLPSVDELLQSATGQALQARFSHTVVVRAIRSTITRARNNILEGAPCPSLEALLAETDALLCAEQQPHLRTVINATGVIINTNLGRAPLSQAALQAVHEVSTGYSNLEYDLT